MSIIAWIVLAFAAGLIANLLIPGRRQQGLALTCIIGVAAILLLAYRLISGRSSSSSGWFAHR